MIPLMEKYRPNKIDNIILDEKNLKIFKYFLKEKKVPNLLFFGPPGTGKTSSILALSKELYGENFKYMVLELNASNNRNIQVVRKIIKEFSSTKNLFNGGTKLVILDEVDSMTNDAQFCLRRIIEIYSKNVRFCFICNNIGKIIEAIKSRCTIFNFSNICYFQIKKKIKNILEIEKISIKNNIIDIIINDTEGDMRKILNIMEIFKYHNPTNNLLNYYSILGIPNKNYIKNMYNLIINLKNIKELLKLTKKIIFGLNKGYYNLNLFVNYIFDLFIQDENNLKNKEIIENLSEIELYTGNKDMKICTIHYLLVLFLV